MKTRGRILFGLLSVILVCGIAWETVRSREPVYQGRSLSQWLDEYNRAGTIDNDWSNIPPISQAIRAMGTNCLPFLLANIRHSDSPLKKKLFRLAANQHWLRLPNYAEDFYFDPSLLALDALGKDALPLAPDFLKMAQGATNIFFWKGLYGLFAIGPDAVPYLSKACESTNLQVRQLAFGLILKLSAAPDDSSSKHRYIINWRRDRLSGRPILGFGIIIPNPQGVRFVSDPNPAIRLASIEYLGAVPEAQDLVDAFQKATNDPDPKVRLAAQQTLERIKPASPADPVQK